MRFDTHLLNTEHLYQESFKVEVKRQSLSEFSTVSQLKERLMEEAG
jgi:hypothetical protein